MAAEASKTGPSRSSYQRMGRKSQPWGAAEIQCTRCGRRVSRASGEEPKGPPSREAAWRERWGPGHHCELQCGHAFCELCLLMTEECTTIICPDCEVATAVNTRQRYYPMAGYVKEDSVMEKLQPKTIKNCSQDFKKTADQLTTGLEHSASTHRTVLNSSAVMLDTDTAEEIDEALNTAHHNFEQLSIAGKALEHMQKQTIEERERVIEVVEKQFDQLLAFFDSRKKNLCEEFARTTDDYLSNLIEAKSYIEEKKNNLNAAMNIARALQLSPSLRTYCDLNQIIRTLQLTSDSELAQVSSPQLRNPPRLSVNCSEIICMFNNMGKIEFGDSTKCYPQENEIRQNVQKKYNNKKGLSCYDTYPRLEKKKVDMSVLTNEAPPPPLQPETNDIHLEAKNFQPQKDVATASPKTIAVLPQMGSSPDVIIEEIIEDNMETCGTDDLGETPRYPKKPLQKNSSVPFGSKAGSAELVFVSHVIDPCHFYIRKYSQIKDAKVLEKKVNEFCNRSSHLDPSDILELGARIFVNSIKNGMWCRGTITELIPIEGKNTRKPCSPTRLFVHEVALMQIFMVDFGNSEVLIVTGVVDTHVRPEHSAKQHIALNDLCLVLRKSEPYIEGLLKDIQPLAQPCSLKDIVPQNSNEGWEEEAKVEFLKMVNNKAVSMKVFREEDGVLIVDLQKPPPNKISSDMPVSLRDALVFMELAKFKSQSLRSHFEKNTTFHYHPPILPKEMTDVSVTVCHINSPGDFYLQLIEGLDFLFLLKTIEEFYKSEDGENLEILCPVQDEVCVAKFEDGVWYRAKVIELDHWESCWKSSIDRTKQQKLIIQKPVNSSLMLTVCLSHAILIVKVQIKGLPGHQEVEVRYVDFGNTAKITIKDVRKIKDEFLNAPEKAIKCKLAYIEPYKRTMQWSKEAKEKFEEKAQDKFMTCSVIKILEDNVLLVELFDSLGAPEMTTTSINDQLVKEGLASYEIGYILKDNSQMHIEVWDPSPEEIISNEVHNLNPVSAKSLPNENFQSLYNKELPVHICNVISPEKIYVQWLLTENLLNSLEEKMIAAYQNSKWEPVKWENDMHCAVKIQDKNQWRRGQIIRMVTDTLVEVLLYDVGVELVVNVDCLRKLQENLKTMGRLSLECSLVDIRPAGGSDKWTATACDCLSLYLTGAVATIILQVDSEVQYLDHGFTEKIPQCHLYPILLYPDIPQFCIPCQLHNTTPVGNVWQPDAIEVLQQLLSKREVDIHIMELPKNPWEKLSIHLYFDGMSLSYFMAYYKYCTSEHTEEMLKEKPRSDHDKKYEEEQWEIRFEELLSAETDTPLLPPYLSSSLPSPGELYAVQVKHVVSPNEVYICLDSIETCNQSNQHSDTDDSGVSGESQSESLDEALQRVNKKVEALPPLTDFRTEMPCLAEYDDGLWYRAKIVAIKEFNPLSILVQFVDYGSTAKLTLNRLCQIPSHLMRYPARAIKVLLAGFKPPLRDLGETRIPYCPKWSMEALWAMIDCLQGKQLYAVSMAPAPEQIVTLYDDEQHPVHMPLVEMGLADKDE
ncbi:RING finger protein 17 isoform X8 [Pongo abelii]|uniref:RING finger protein 17 isoform X8 n=1 Tax=Pongo abelii TaxID=9601 RepID=UPI0023E8162C|nr:RING finger protein 17 isoform X8 [Pongo abelii]